MFPSKYCFKKYNKTIAHRARKRDMMANLTPFMAVQVLITRIIHRLMLHFEVAGSIVYERNYTSEKT